MVPGQIGQEALDEVDRLLVRVDAHPLLAAGCYFETLCYFLYVAFPEPNGSS